MVSVLTPYSKGRSAPQEASVRRKCLRGEAGKARAGTKP
jgi:hypothetical protein